MWFNTGENSYYRWSSPHGEAHYKEIAIGRMVDNPFLNPADYKGVTYARKPEQMPMKVLNKYFPDAERGMRVKYRISKGRRLYAFSLTFRTQQAAGKFLQNREVPTKADRIYFARSEGHDRRVMWFYINGGEPPPQQSLAAFVKKAGYEPVNFGGQN